MNYSKNDLVQYRIEKAEEALSDAVFLLEKESWNAITNRLYYACFYITSAYLASQEIKASTHSSVKSAFNLYLIKPGKLSQEVGGIFNELFNMRQEADYEDFEDIKKEDVISLFDGVQKLILDIKNIIEEKN